MYDFDAAWAEEDDEPYRLTLLGREWACKRPSEVPAALLLKLDRMLSEVTRQALTGQPMDDDLVVDPDLSTESIVRQMAGDANVDAWLAGVEQADGTVKRLSYRQLAAVSRHLNAVYHGQDPGEARAANRQTRRAAAKPKRSASKKS